MNMTPDIEQQIRNMYLELRAREELNHDQAIALDGLLGGADAKLVCKGSELAYSIAADMVYQLLSCFEKIRIAA
ncbi:hypothetical protein NZD89_27945 (plasmid) [Alicyclobacillus fastidiosus]|uniref:Uncharacterized protein n=1 Tax=Alicyclobacillus fastidiosus TaxID=392011 RepID=A0ABY6ZPW1_9BACL|nr:hypothetical protein [Alicyclobacillus fastidiosus]WAH44882.1 hypothetical protein NZD89_27945 [Alicyclobacillus fastidiosus]GMA65639.1 hypothetical protein GCM10025859_60790 [Alicyclobacillus fastidiosus]GMA65858.1 hypothetical protein GCM10025859_62980 [Alicyclobacillus fastidiosus]